MFLIDNFRFRTPFLPIVRIVLMLPFIMYLNCIHDGHHISVLLLLLEKCIVNQPRGYGGCSSLNSDVWPRAPPRFLPFSTNCVACGFEKGFSYRVESWPFSLMHFPSRFFSKEEADYVTLFENYSKCRI